MNMDDLSAILDIFFTKVNNLVIVRDRGGHPTFFGIWSTGLGADVGKNTVQEVVSLIKIDMYLFTYKGGSLQ